MTQARKLLSRKPMSDNWELNKKHEFFHYIFKVGHPEASSISIKTSPRDHLFSDFKLYGNLIDSGIENDLKIDTKKLAQTGRSTLGDSLATPWGPPGTHQGHEIYNFRCQF